MISFVSGKTSFGRYETFPLCFGWLTNGYAAYEIEPGVCGRSEAKVTQCISKSMVGAIKYWLTASILIAPVEAEGAIELDLRLFSSSGGWDEYLEDEVKLWLVQWLFSSNTHYATPSLWFFNPFHKPEFRSAKAYVALREFVSENVASKVSYAALKNDVAVLLCMHASIASAKTSPIEDGFGSPSTTLGMLQRPMGEQPYALRRSGACRMQPFGTRSPVMGTAGRKGQRLINCWRAQQTFVHVLKRSKNVSGQELLSSAEINDEFDDESSLQCSLIEHPRQRCTDPRQSVDKSME